MKKLLLITYILATLCVTALADESDFVRATFEDFSGGLNTQDSPSSLAINQSPNCLNVIADEYGKLNRRKDTLYVSNFKATRFFKYGLASGENYVIALSTSGELHSSQDMANWELIRTGVNTEFQSLDYTVLEDKIWFTDGVNDVFSWNKNSIESYDFIVKGSQIEAHNGRLFVAEGTNLFFSEVLPGPSEEDSWSALNQFFVGRNDGQVITCLFSYKGKLYIGKEDSIWVLLGWDNETWQLRRIVDDYGIKQGDSLDVFLDTVIAVSKDGVIAFDGTSATLISESIRDDILQTNAIRGGTSILRIDSSDFPNGTTTYMSLDYGSLGLAEYEIDHSTFGNPTGSSSVDFSGDNLKLDSSGVTPTFDLLEPPYNSVFAYKTYDNFKLEVTEVTEDSGFQTYTPNSRHLAVDGDFSTKSRMENDRIEPWRAYTRNRTKGVWGYFNLEFEAAGLYCELDIGDTDSLVEVITKLKYGNDWNVIEDYELEDTRAAFDFDLEFVVQRRDYLDFQWHTIYSEDIGRCSTNFRDYEGTNFIGDFERGRISDDFGIVNRNGNYVPKRADKIRVGLILTPSARSYVLTSLNTDDAAWEYEVIPSMDVFELQARVHTGTAAVYDASGYFISATQEVGEGQLVLGGEVKITDATPENTSITYTFYSSTDNLNWSAGTVAEDGDNLSEEGLPPGRYFRYRADLATTETTSTPSLERIQIDFMSSNGTFVSEVKNVGELYKWKYLDVDDIMYDSVTSSYAISLGTYPTASSLDNFIYKDVPEHITDLTDPASSYFKVRAYIEATNASEKPYVNYFKISWVPEAEEVYSASEVVSDNFWLAMSTGSIENNNVIYVYDDKGAWWLFDIDANDIIEYKNKFYVCNSSGIIRVEYDDNYNGNSMLSYWQSPDLTPSDLKTNTELRYIVMEADSSSTTVHLAWRANEYETSFSSAPVSLYSGGYGKYVDKTNVGLMKIARSYRFKLESNSDEEQYRIIAIEPYFRPRNWIR